jgi:hypothetical protein
MKRKPPAPKYVTRCLWCGGLIGNGVTSWTTRNKTQLHDDECPARSALSPTTGVTEETPAMSAALTDAEWRELVAAAVEMARKAKQEQQRAEEAEYHIEQLRGALDSAERIGERAAELATERDAALARIARAERLIDSWEHDAPDHSNPVFIGRLRECLRRDPAPVRLREGAVPERQVGSFEDMHPERCPMTEHSPPEAGCDSECPGCECGEHQWLDRPESDTRECLICGTEVAG